MFGGDRDLDTICAISTPPGVGGIHVIRVSGVKALSIVKKGAPFLPDTIESHHVYFGTFFWNGDLNDPIDEVLVSFFRQGRSFTGEETIEISCHGSPFIAGRIVKCLLVFGARTAEPGEFTYRAFLNEKLDLVQAEGILSLIHSESQKSAEIALRQLKGGLSQLLRLIETEIVSLLARLEISIDFTTEDIEIMDVSELRQRVSSISFQISKLLRTFCIGTKIQSGFRVVLVGEPNVGKSSLLNRILSEERAIVTEVPGTTRDLIQEQIIIKGVKVTLIDSAGIRETSDIVEKIGVSRTITAIEEADLVLAVFDCTEPRVTDLVGMVAGDLSKLVLVGNKRDLVSDDQVEGLRLILREMLAKLNKFPSSKGLETFINERCKFVSSFDLGTQDDLLRTIELELDTGSFGDVAVLSQARHFENLQRASECFARTIELAEADSSPEFLALEVKEGLIRIQEILGERFDDQILDRIFGEFCIGK
jgi:tRNA modification GTPase